MEKKLSNKKASARPKKLKSGFSRGIDRKFKKNEKEIVNIEVENSKSDESESEDEMPKEPT